MAAMPTGAEDAVIDAATLTAEEALEMNVIEFIAEDHADLLDPGERPRDQS